MTSYSSDHIHTGQWCHPCVQHGAAVMLEGVAEAEKVRRELPGLDVKRLATVLRVAYVKGPGYTLSLRDDAEKWAEIIAAEYARLGDKP